MDQSKKIASEDVASELCTPVGTIEFAIDQSIIFEKDTQGIFFEVPAGLHYFRLERNPNFILRFFHSSPTSGTRVATISLAEISPAKVLRVKMGWSPTEMGFSVCALYQEHKMLIGHGVESEIKFYVGVNGQVIQASGSGLSASGIRFTQGGKNILEPSAIDTWKETLKAIDILVTGKSDEGIMYEVVKANMTISMLVTGLESYAKKRFKELEQEGVQANIEAVINSFCSVKERKSRLVEILTEEAKENKISLLSHIANQRINFQNFENLKRAFNKAYGIQISKLAGAKQCTSNVQKFIRYRHKIIHVSPLLTMLAKPGDEFDSKESVFANSETAGKARKSFHDLIETIHSETVKIQCV